MTGMPAIPKNEKAELAEMRHDDRPGRMLYVDNLRIALTALVIIHHAAVCYGGTGGWYYLEGRQDAPTVALLGWLCATNQAFFMSLFFMLSGYFSAASREKKGARAFLKDRLVRLGIPLLIFDNAVNPILRYWREVKFGGYQGGPGGFIAGYFRHYEGIGRGPLWFVETLLLFTAAWLAWRALSGESGSRRDDSGFRLPSRRSILIFSALMGLIAFAVRLFMRVGHGIGFLNLQVPYCPLYIAFFAIGIRARGRDWPALLTAAEGRFWLRLGIVSILLCPVIMIAGGAIGGNADVFLGGPTWQAMSYALWEPFVCAGMCIGLTALFRERFNSQGAFLARLSRDAYAAYVIHAPVLVFLGYTIRPIEIHPLLKFAGVSALGVAISFAAARLIVFRVPGADRVF
ncbi:MAG TPA: acyltransferase [Candidatus Brocadiia bacterium]|nr:acyltransferase [Candidatus Brocadiia bacterium]